MERGEQKRHRRALSLYTNAATHATHSSLGSKSGVGVTGLDGGDDGKRGIETGEV